MTRILLLALVSIVGVGLAQCGVSSSNRPASPALPSSTRSHSFALSAHEVGQMVEQASWGKGSILGAGFSPDGRRLEVSTPLGTYIYETGTRQQLHFIPDDHPITIGAFAPDWSVLATGSRAAITLRRVADGQAIMHLTGMDGAVARLLFSPDGRWLAGLVTPPGEEVYRRIVELWRLSDGKLSCRWEIGASDDVTFAPDSKAFLAWSASQSAAEGVRRWQIPSCSSLPAWSDLHPFPSVFSPDGTLYASNEYHTVAVERLADRHEVGTLVLQGSGFFRQIQFSPDGSLLIALAEDGWVQVWSRVEARGSVSFHLDPGMDSILAISPDDGLLAAQAVDGIGLYRISDGVLVGRLQNHPNGSDRGVLSARGDRLAAITGNDAVAVWSLPDGKLLYVVPQIEAFRLAWSPDGKWLVLGQSDGNLRILRASDGVVARSIRPLSGSIAQVLGLDFSPGGDLLAASTAYSIKLWKFSGGTLIRDIGVRGGFVSDVRFSPDGRLLEALQGDQTIGVWQVENGRHVLDLPAPVPSYSNVVDFAPDGSLLAIGDGPQVRLWDIRGARLLRSMPAGNAGVSALRISDDGSLMVCGLADGSLHFLRIQDGKLLRTVQAGYGPISNLEFTSDGARLVAASGDGIFSFWGVEQK